MRPAPSAPTRKAPPGAVPGPDGERLVVIGELAGAHGVRGEARLKQFNPDSSLLGGVSDVFILGDGATTRRRLEGARPHGSVWLVMLQGLTSREEVRALQGCRIAVRERDLPRLQAGQFYCYQLVGVAVFDESGMALGRVSGVLSTGGNDVLVVSGSGREHLIPMIDRAVREVDLEGGRIVVHPLEGAPD